MPKVKPVKLLEKNFIKEFNYDKTKINVMNYFARYREYLLRIEYIETSYSSALSNDNLGIYSSSISDTTGKKGIKLADLSDYVDRIDADIRKLKLKLTDDEKIILNASILHSTTDEDLAILLSLDRTGIYQRKKSCFIKVALFYGLEVYK